MYVQVKLLNGFGQPLWYKIPPSWPAQSWYGRILEVPIQQRKESGIVIFEQRIKPTITFELKEVIAEEKVPKDEFYDAFLKQLCTYYQISQTAILRRIRSFLHQKEQKKDVMQKERAPYTIATLTAEQEKARSFVSKNLNIPIFTPVLLHGLTGSGKTEVYKKLIEQTITQGKNVLLLLPEVTLAIGFTQRLLKELPDIPIYSFHSGSSVKDKRMVWQRAIEKKPMLIIGVHLPALLPIPNLGLIIVDEEHEVGYQEKKHPKINSKEAALIRAKVHKIPIVLGSATPSVSSLFNVEQKKWHYFSLKKRFSGKLPTVKQVFLSDKKQRKHFWISQELYAALQDRLQKKEQALIYLNRRGYSFFVQCKECSYIFSCSACSVSLTLHEHDELTCHYCGYKTHITYSCPSCKEKDSLIKKGLGTQQCVTILQKLFPDARIARADLDTTTKKKQWNETLKAFEEQEIDILVGTQTITKGYDFPHVTLVGIIWADIQLNFPIYNASETTLQQLIQVAGRAGRHSAESLVIIQSMADHHIFNYVQEEKYFDFYKDEIETRQQIGYPPALRLVEIELKHTQECTIEKESHALATYLNTLTEKNDLKVTILGPAKPPVHKIKNTYSYKIYLKCTRFDAALKLWSAIKHDNYQSSIYFNPNPVT